MFKFFQAIKSIKKLKALEPNQRWLKALRMQFSRQISVPVTGHSYSGARLTLTFASLILIFALGGSGLVNSAQAAFPGDALYPVKLLAERVQEALTIGEENKINLALRFAEKRLEESEKMDQKNSDKAIVKAEENFNKAEIILKKIADGNKNNGKEFKDLDKIVERLENLSQRKNQLAKKLQKRLPKFTTVTVERDENSIIVTFGTTNASGTPENASSTPTFKINPGTERIIKLLTDGAGKSRKIPPGLLRAPGIEKKLATTTDSDDSE